MFKFGEMINNTVFMAKYVIGHPDVQKLLKSDVKFDLVISELALNEAILGKKSNHLFRKIFLFTNFLFKRLLGIL